MELPSLKLPFVAAIIGLTISAPSNAMSVATYKGVLSSGFDQRGLFGAANTDISGKSFELSFTYFRYTREAGGISPRVGQYYVGAPEFASPFRADNFVTSLTIDGITRIFKPINDGLTGYGARTTPNFRVRHSFYASRDNGGDGPTSKFRISAKFPTVPVDFWTAVAPTTVTSISGSFFCGDLETNPTLFVNGNFSGPGTYEVSILPEPFVQTSVPEPASWAMMIIGFGLVGAAKRRGRRHVEATAA